MQGRIQLFEWWGGGKLPIKLGLGESTERNL